MSTEFHIFPEFRIFRDLAEVVGRAELDRAIRGLILTGAGTRVFAARTVMPIARPSTAESAHGPTHACMIAAIMHAPQAETVRWDDLLGH